MLISMVPGHKASRSGSSLFLKEDISGFSRTIVHMVPIQTRAGPEGGGQGSRPPPPHPENNKNKNIGFPSKIDPNL